MLFGVKFCYFNFYLAISVFKLDFLHVFPTLSLKNLAPTWEIPSNLLYGEWQLPSWAFLLCFQVSSLDAKILRTVISVLYGKSSLAENKSYDFKVCNWDRATVVFHSGSSDHINIFAEAKALEEKSWTSMIAMFYHIITC